MKYDSTYYEMPWRRNYELGAAVTWFFALFASFACTAACFFYFGFVAWPQWLIVYAFIVVMLAWRAYEARTLAVIQRTISGRPLTFIDFPGLVDLILNPVVGVSFGRLKRRHIKPSEIKTLWLGKGFAWQTKHAQRVSELIKRNRQDLDIEQEGDESSGFSDQTGRMVNMGQNWIHGVESYESDLWQPISHVQGHTLILGTTGAGKTRLFDILIAQAVLRDESVIIIDPKGDIELRENARRACARLGYESRFVPFDLAHPKESVRIDPMQNFNEPSELATRIAALMPGEDAFTQFGWQVVSAVAEGLLLIYSKPTLENLYTYIQGGVTELVTNGIRNFAEKNDVNYQEHLKEVLQLNRYEACSGLDIQKGEISVWVDPKKARYGEDFGSDGTGEQKIAVDGELKAKYWVAYYKKFMKVNYPKTAIMGLIALFEHDKEHLSKMITNLIPILSQLTSGEVGPLLSPVTDGFDTRPINDLMRITSTGQVCYIGLNCLANAVVGQAVGSIMLADLTNVAANRYNYTRGERIPISVFVDESAEVANNPFVQLLNKSRGAGFRIFAATQTIADFESRLGSAAEMHKVLGNFNNVISLRLKDPDTMNFFADSVIKTRTQYVMRSQSTSTDGENPLLANANLGERLMEEEAPLIPPQLLGMLPNLEYFALVSGGTLLKARIPILVDKLPEEVVQTRRPQSRLDRFFERIGF